MKLLLVTHVSPVPTASGGAQRTHLLYQALAACGEVDLVLLTRPGRFTAMETVRLEREFRLRACLPIQGPEDRGAWRWLPLSRRWRKRLSHSADGSRWLIQEQPQLRAQVERAVNLSDYDVIVGRFTRSIACLGLHRHSPAPLALDVDDWDPDRYRSRLEGRVNSVERAILERHLRNLHVGLPGVLDTVQTLWVANPDNLSEPPLRRAHVLPNIPFHAPGKFTDRLPEGEVVMTIGSYAYRPNVHGVDWFLREVWPGVLASRPQAILRIYGSSLPPAQRTRWSSNRQVEVIGYVENVDDAYASATATLCTVPSGAGSNVKVLESLAHGRACITTRSGARGFRPLVEAGAILTCNHAQEMIDTTCSALADRTATLSRGQLGCQRVQQDYTFAAFAATVAAGLQSALEGDRNRMLDTTLAAPRA